MKSKLLTLLLAGLILAACGTTATTTPTTLPPTATTEAATGCNAATDNTQTLTDEALGYCVLIPSGFNISHPIDNEAVIFLGPQLGEGQPQVFIVVEEASGRTPDAYADFLSAGAEQFNPVRTETTLGGEPALVIDKLPGQDVNRQVVVGHGEKLYHLTFVPLDASNAEIVKQVENLYTLVMQSFEFVAIKD